MSLLHKTNMPSETRNKMLYAALHLFDCKGFKQTSILEVVERARVSKTTFYQYFQSKEELLASLYRRLADEMMEDVKRVVESEERMGYKAYVGVRRYMEICVTRSAVAKLLLVESVGVSQAVERARREAHRSFAELIYQTVQAGAQASLPDGEAKVVALAMVGAINEVVIQKLSSSDEKDDLDRLARLLNRIVVASFVNCAMA
ncbi:TetR/AcrR family transcriptional regulator [Laceyella putida]|uniref:TetR/AcrR family transcriptional regulator n=2 Tax=Laceyella putida TaxID=110101 RepID=A0ABW2RHF6_9BACL